MRSLKIAALIAALATPCWGQDEPRRGSFIDEMRLDGIELRLNALRSGVPTLTSSPTFRGTLNIPVSGTGIVFPDGKKQTIAFLLDMSGSSLTANAFIINCPSGFTSVIANSQQLGCMQTDENGTNTWSGANDACFDAYGGRLPTGTEWNIACNNYSLTNETDDSEWTAESQNATNALRTSTDCVPDDESAKTTGSVPYRCWLPK